MYAPGRGVKCEACRSVRCARRRSSPGGRTRPSRSARRGAGRSTSGSGSVRSTGCRARPRTVGPRGRCRARTRIPRSERGGSSFEARRGGGYRRGPVKRALKLGLSLAVTVVCSWYAFHDAHWSEQWASLRAANLWWGVPYLALLLGVHLCRTLRWGSLLSGLERVKFRGLNEASGIGFMLLIVLPLRLGEFARPFLIAQRSRIRRSPAMTTVVLERIVDGIFVAVLLRVLLFFIPRDAPAYGTAIWAGNAMFLIFAGGLAFLLFAWWQRERAVRLVRKIAQPISPRAANEVARIVDSFVGAMHQLPSGKELVKFFAYTTVYWGLNGFGMMVMARAFDASGGDVVSLRLSLFQAYVVMCALVVGVMI